MGKIVPTGTISNARPIQNRLAHGEQNRCTPLAGEFGPEVYTAWRVSSLGKITEALEHGLILQLAEPLHDWPVLDVGCGDGTLASDCARKAAALDEVGPPDGAVRPISGRSRNTGGRFVAIQATKSQPDGCLNML
jgi:hypothetical protein